LAQYLGETQVYGMRQSGRQEYLRASEGNEQSRHRRDTDQVFTDLGEKD